MKKILLLGGGKIGFSIAKMLGEAGGYEVTLADRDDRRLAQAEGLPVAGRRRLDAGDPAQVEPLARQHDVVVSACSFDVNPGVAAAALRAGASYFDLTEDVRCTAAVREIALSASKTQAFVPQCGLAPGFIGMVGAKLVRSLDETHHLKLRVGALPKYPSNRLMYNLTWSTEGLINEYCNPCDAIQGGRPAKLAPLEGLESLSCKGVRYEAFNTSGGLGTLAETLLGSVRDLTYKTVRYPGHRDYVDFLVNELKLGHTARGRQTLKEIFESSIATTHQDVVIVWASAEGLRGGEYQEIHRCWQIEHAEGDGEAWTAIQMTTAAGLCGAIELYFEKKIPSRGFVRQEDIDLDLFLGTSFGRYYRPGALTAAPSSAPAERALGSGRLEVARA
ncbi:MAG: saccharopine dehydrogenase NADP-binding domain-containing protein [Polyangiaceae bacterium]|jgi:saccharopine dehydrogenase-like NADP-dependent oxidoreductase|nr:saccharopine dehydrogenase NADP-binding domain-containing protein [Polyangiaceae bacterium]